MAFVNTSVVMPPTPTNPASKFSRSFSGQPIAGITKKGGEIAMTTAEKLRQEGLQKGRQEGSYKMMVTMVHNAGQ